MKKNYFFWLLFNSFYTNLTLMEILKVGMKIKKLRELRNFTQEFLAERLDMSQTGYSKIERGETDISISRLQQIAKVLAVEIQDILGFDEKMIFNLSNNNQGESHGIVIHSEVSDRERDLYAKQLAYLQEEIKYLREQLNLLNSRAL